MRNPGLRFTSGKLKQAIFNILGERVSGANFLELFAGSGAVGGEALKRGAESVTFVDRDIKRCNVQGARCEVKPSTFHLEPRTIILQMDAFYAIRRFGKTGERFDIIFLDPPYYGALAKKTLNLIARYDILSKTGIVIVEHYKKDILPEAAGHLTLFKQRRYGDTSLSFYALNDKWGIV